MHKAFTVYTQTHTVHTFHKNVLNGRTRHIYVCGYDAYKELTHENAMYECEQYCLGAMKRK